MLVHPWTWPKNSRALLNPEPSPYSDTGADAAIARQAQLETWSKSTSVEASTVCLGEGKMQRERAKYEGFFPPPSPRQEGDVWVFSKVF